MVSFKTCDMPVIIPNLTLKKIMTDIISDGGSGLYCHDTSQNNRIFELKQENVLIWKCVAPTESDWNSRSFRAVVSVAEMYMIIEVVKIPSFSKIRPFLDSTLKCSVRKSPGSSCSKIWDPQGERTCDLCSDNAKIYTPG